MSNIVFVYSKYVNLRIKYIYLRSDYSCSGSFSLVFAIFIPNMIAKLFYTDKHVYIVLKVESNQTFIPLFLYLL